MTTFASLCILAYKRPELLERCLKSLRKTADYPYELIINYDAVNEWSDIGANLDKGPASKIILSSGKNRGVGRAFENCLGLVEGEYIFKIDTDLIFKPHWLSTAIGILDNNIDIGAVSIFDYNHYDPNDERFKSEICHLEKRVDCILVDDFVSSFYGFRADDLDCDEKITDDGLHQSFGKMAITKEDYCTNEGFGVTKSTYVSGTEEHPFKTPTYNEPLIFNSENSSLV